MPIERWGWYSIGVNLVLLAVHAAIAVASSSLAVTAELVHNVADLLTSFAVLLGVRLSGRKSSAFPYGLYEPENLVAALLALAVFATAYEILREALLAPPRNVTVDGWMLGGVVVTTAIPLAFSRYEMRAGLESNSPALLADAREYRVHVLTTGLVLAALLSRGLDLPIDRFAAFVIAIVVLKTGWDLLSDAMRVLLDASLDAGTLSEIRSIIAAEPAVADVTWLTGRNAGRFRFVEAGVRLRITELARAQGVIQRIESRIRASIPHVDRVLLHREALISSTLRYAVPLGDIGGTVSPHFGSAPYFALVTVNRSDLAIQEQRLLPNPHQAVEKKKGIRVAEWLVAQKPDVLLVREDLRGKGPEYVLGNAEVELRHCDEGTLAAALDAARHEER